MSTALRSYFAELIGTFMLVFVGTAVAVLQSPGVLSANGWGAAGLIGISFAFGGTLAVLVIVIGPVSGCHVNPAVTLPMAVAGKLPWKHLVGYIVAQLIGAVLASIVLYLLLKGLPDYNVVDDGLGANGNAVNQKVGALLGWEIVLTALFLLTIFCATRADQPSMAAPAAIGGFLFLAHLIGAQLGDSSVNPARSIGPAVVETVLEKGDAMRVLWVFIVGPLVGGVAGWGLYRLVHRD